MDVEKWRRRHLLHKIGTKKSLLGEAFGRYPGAYLEDLVHFGTFVRFLDVGSWEARTRVARFIACNLRP